MITFKFDVSIGASHSFPRSFTSKSATVNETRTNLGSRVHLVAPSNGGPSPSPYFLVRDYSELCSNPLSHFAYHDHDQPVFWAWPPSYPNTSYEDQFFRYHHYRSIQGTWYYNGIQIIKLSCTRASGRFSESCTRHTCGIERTDRETGFGIIPDQPKSQALKSVVLRFRATLAGGSISQKTWCLRLVNVIIMIRLRSR